MTLPNGAGFFPEYEDVPRNFGDEDDLDIEVEQEGIDYDEYWYKCVPMTEEEMVDIIEKKVETKIPA